MRKGNNNDKGNHSYNRNDSDTYMDNHNDTENGNGEDNDFREAPIYLTKLS